MKKAHNSDMMKINSHNISSKLILALALLLAPCMTVLAGMRNYVFVDNGPQFSPKNYYYEKGEPKGKPTRATYKYNQITGNTAPTVDGVTDWSGKYLLVGSTARAYNGTFSNSKFRTSSVTINTNSITNPTGVSEIEIIKKTETSNYYIKFKKQNDENDYYLYTNTTGETILSTTVPTNDTYGQWSLTLSSGYVTIASVVSGMTEYKLKYYTGTTEQYSFWVTNTSNTTNYKNVRLFKKQDNYTITYDANGGSGSMTDSNNPYINGDVITVLENTFIAPSSGKGFVMWNTAPDGSGTNYEPCATFPMPTNDVTLYAQWGNMHDITVTPVSSSVATVTTTPANEAPTGLTVFVNVTPNTGYALDNVTATDGSGDPVTLTTVYSSTLAGYKYKFTMPDSDITITATFYEQNNFFYKKVTENRTDWSGAYLLAGQNVNTTNPEATYVFTGSNTFSSSGTSGATSISVSNGIITNPSGVVELNIEYVLTESNIRYYSLSYVKNGTRYYLGQSSTTGSFGPVVSDTVTQTPTDATYLWKIEAIASDNSYDYGSVKITNKKRALYIAHKNTSSIKAFCLVNSLSSHYGSNGDSYPKLYYKARTITVNDPTANGTVTVDKEYAGIGEIVTITTHPDIGYATTSVSTTPSLSITGDINTTNVFTFVMGDRDVEVNVTFGVGSSSAYHTITCSPTSGTPNHGYITANQATAAPGTIVTITDKPDTDYQLSSLSYTPEGGSSTTIDFLTTKQFSMPGANVNVTAIFGEKYIKVTDRDEDKWAGKYILGFHGTNGQYGGQYLTSAHILGTPITLSSNNDTVLIKGNSRVYWIEYGGIMEGLTDANAVFNDKPYYHICFYDNGIKKMWRITGTNSMDEVTSPDSNNNYHKFMFYENSSDQFQIKSFYTTGYFLYAANSSTNHWITIATGQDNVEGYTASGTNCYVYLYRWNTDHLIEKNIVGEGTITLGGECIAKNATDHIAYPNATVTIAVSPSSGYALHSITVTDSNNNEITISGNTSGDYEFIMPNDDVTINASFTMSDCMEYGTYDISTPNHPSTVAVVVANVNDPVIAKFPYSPYHSHTYKQIIYKGTSIPEKLTSIGFMYYLNNTSLDLINNNVSVYVCDTTLSTLSEWIDINKMTKVYEGPMSFIHPNNNAWNWTDFTFNLNGGKFDHNKSKNLVIAIHDHSQNPLAQDTRGFFYDQSENIVQLYNATGTSSTATGYNFDNNGKPIYASNSNAATANTSKYYPITHFCGPTEPETYNTWVEAVTTQPAGYSESGTNITISSKEGLAWLITAVKNSADGLSGTTVNLTADVDMSEYTWVPIGYSLSKPFAGTFNGNYHTIKGIHISDATEISDVETATEDDMLYTGLFGYTSGATIKNTFVLSGQLANNQASGYLGGLVGYANNSTIEMCETADTLTALANLAAVGGMIGGAADGTTAKGVMVMGNIDLGTEVANAGAVIGVGAAPETFFTNHTITGDATTKNVAGTNGYVRVSNANFDATAAYKPGNGEGQYSSPVAYQYGDYATNNAVNGKPLYETLNENLNNGFQWIRPKGSLKINGGYPFIARKNNDAILAVANKGNEKPVYYGEANSIMGNAQLGGQGTTDIYIYSNGIITTTPSAASLFIDEHASIKQPEGAKEELTIAATVGITMDNSANNGEMHRDWHTFASSLTAGQIGMVYGNSQPTVANNVPSELAFPEDYSLVQGNPAVYFPDGITEANGCDGTEFDVYSFYEPEYHWINLKRAGNNHWHEDGGAHIDYNGGGSANTNETIYTPGKGYLIAIGDNSNAKKVYMSATGTLQNGDENEEVKVTVTNSGNHLTGYNLLGNPYQSYLDFQEFAKVNENIIWGNDHSKGYLAYLIYDADRDGFDEYLFTYTDGGEQHVGQSFSQGSLQTASRYIHPHQGFFVVKKTADDASHKEVVFNNDMRSITETSSFRDEVKPAYPLVNLVCTDNDGKREISVIEFERPSMAGSLRMKNMLGAKGNMYIRWEGEDFGNVFLTGTPEYVPVWFKAVEAGVFTMTWSTANGDFSTLRLIDNLTGANIDMLTTDSYSFEAKPSDSKARFRLVFSALGIDEETTECNGNFAFFNGNELVVNGEGELSLIDLNGRMLNMQHLSGQQSHIVLPKVASGMYMLRLANSEGVRVQKIVIRK